MLGGRFCRAIKKWATLTLTLTLAACGRFRPNPSLHVFSGTSSRVKNCPWAWAGQICWVRTYGLPQDMPIWGALCTFITAFFFFFSLFCSCDTTWNEQSNRCHWIYLLGIFQPPQPTGLVLPDLPGHLSDNPPWEHTHNNIYQDQFCSPHSNVLLSEQLELLGHLLHIHHHSSYANELLPGEEDHLLWQLPFPDLFPRDMCWCWMCITGSYGLWSLCSHLPPSSIPSLYECEGLCLFGVWVLAMWTGEFYDTHSVGNHTHSMWA